MNVKLLVMNFNTFVGSKLTFNDHKENKRVCHWRFWFIVSKKEIFEIHANVWK